MGLPLKISDNAKVIDNHFKNFINTDLDVVGGNSGGPVLNDKNEVVGVVVRAMPSDDLVYHADLKCSTLNVCEKMGIGDCAVTTNEPVLGTQVQRLEPIMAKLKELKIF